MKATDTAVRPRPMIVSCFIDLGTAPLSLEGGRFPFFSLTLPWPSLSEKSWVGGTASVSIECIHLWGWLGSIQMSIVNILWKKRPYTRFAVPSIQAGALLYLITAKSFCFSCCKPHSPSSKCLHQAAGLTAPIIILTATVKSPQEFPGPVSELRALQHE